jgi:hypothetical protein
VRFPRRASIRWDDDAGKLDTTRNAYSSYAQPSRLRFAGRPSLMLGWQLWERPMYDGAALQVRFYLAFSSQSLPVLLGRGSGVIALCASWLLSAALPHLGVLFLW